MDGSRKIKRATLPERIGWLCLFYLFFSCAYGFTGWYTARLDGIGSVVFDFEHFIPFIPWMIFPYMSSGLFFVYVFYLASQKTDLYLLVKRLLFITLLSVLFYLLFPLQYSFIKPETEGLPGSLFALLSKWDTPYNQAPSLHISYAFIFWSVIRKETSGLLKRILGVWLLLMGIATLTIYQHHLTDILASFILVPFTLLLFPDQTTDFRQRNHRIANIYFLGSSCLLAGAFWLYHTISSYGLLLVWIAVSLFVVGIAYLHSNAVFLKKEDGKIGLFSKFLCYPYILSYHLIWKYVRKAKEKPVTEFLPGLFIGARLSARQSRLWGMDKKTIVFDLSAEIEENSVLRKAKEYHCCPVLDIAGIDPDRLHALADMICERYNRLEPDDKIYIHCTMGYSRSMMVGVLLLTRLLQINNSEAAAMVKEKHPQAVLPGYVYEMN